jgi:predicted Na+-dependent transporter
MFSRHLGYEIAILTVICTIAIFFFPAACGPYSAVHGPVTALLSLRMRLKLRLRIVVDGFHQWRRALLNSLRTALQNALLPQSVPSAQITVLRC